MKLDPKDPPLAGQRSVCAFKGHGAPVLYAALAERWFIPKEDLMTLRRLAVKLTGSS
jgi:transketolase